MNFLKKIITNEGPREFFKNKEIVNSPYLKNIKYCSFGKKNPNKKFYIINRTPGAGLFSNVTYVLNQINICKILNFIPIIDMKNFPTIYNENKKINSTNNSWCYYFLPLNKFSLDEVYKSKNVFFSSGKFEDYMSLDMTHKSIAYLFKYIKIKKEFFLSAKNFAKEKFNKRDKILGVHFRGSTYKVARGHAFPPTKKIVIDYILKLMKKYNYNKIFLVTEESDYLNFLKKTLGVKCLYTEQYRMKKIDSFQTYPRQLHRYNLGKEILIDTILLSKCNGIFYIKSNVVSASILLSKKKKNLHEISLGFNSRNKFLSRWLWYFKSLIPIKYGGLKIIREKSIVK